MTDIRDELIEIISARLHVTTDRITGLTHGIALSADTAAVDEAADAVILWLTAHDQKVRAQTLRGAADLVDRGPTFPLPPSVISELLRERAEEDA